MLRHTLYVVTVYRRRMVSQQNPNAYHESHHAHRFASYFASDFPAAVPNFLLSGHPRIRRRRPRTTHRIRITKVSQKVGHRQRIIYYVFIL